MRIGKLSIIISRSYMATVNKLSWYNWTYYKSKFGDKQLWIRLFTYELFVGWFQ